jgi:hypothetical protein
MDLLEWARGKTEAMTIWDIGVLKVYCVLFGMIVGAFLSGLVRENLWYFILPTVFLGLWSGYRWFTAKPG